MCIRDRTEAGARRALQSAMWQGVGVERDAAGLARAAGDLAQVHDGTGHATDNLLLVARLAAAAGALRTESRGAHFRSDHPGADPRQARRIAWVGDEPYTLPHATARHRALAMEAA